MPLNPLNFTDKIALVCGAGGGGVGTAVSNGLIQGGATVVAVDRTAELVEETRSRAVAAGATCLGIVADLRDPTQVASIVPTIRRELGRIDLVANIAGGTQKHQWIELEQTTDEIYAEVLALNLNYVFAVCRDAARLMIERGRGGAIVNIASISAAASAPFHGPYGAAKAAVTSLTQTMAVEWGKYGIRANTVAPGATRTQRAMATGSSAALDQRGKEWAPLGRPVEKEEIAEAVLFLLSANASAITGQLLTVDCGVTARCVGGDADYYGRYAANRGK
jgi:NAD(P)-dependent dehydrogenase (short-subunit alcohol dehydrogenase family)